MRRTRVGTWCCPLLFATALTAQVDADGPTELQPVADATVVLEVDLAPLDQDAEQGLAALLRPKAA